ncbi:MAG TPA: tRNA-dihydrouridine synthase, partial [Agitococcus sp.]|nr:tRNA-dihydrouridine synthase [Agitococcus sp.]
VDNALAIESAGASWLTIHARTKADGYRPPAHWHELATIRQHVKLPIIANGDIDSVANAQLCQQQSQCTDMMIGRAAVIQPYLIRALRGETDQLTWAQLLDWQRQFLQHMQQAVVNPLVVDSQQKWTEAGAVGRYKQWLGMLLQAWPEAQTLFQQIKKERSYSQIYQIVQQSA